MKSPIYFLIVGILLFPNFSLATIDQCSKDGYTIATINGIFTDEAGAIRNKDALEYKFGKEYKNKNVDFQFLPNPPHLGGLGDIVKSVLQGLFDSETINDYDLVEMLKSASEKVKTQKILLVAHSQGNFYANSFYDTLAGKEGGVPASSIGVYSVATPSGRVAGNGKWITSDTDAVIAGLVGRKLGRSIMNPNTHIALQPDDDTRGHDFSTIYLKYRGNEMVADIQTSLTRLQTNDIQDTQKPCLAPPSLTLGHKIEGALFAAADPTATATNSAVVNAISTVYRASSATTQMAAALYHLANEKIATAIADRVAALKKISFGSAAALYGSSVTLNDLEDDAPASEARPETQTTAQKPKNPQLGNPVSKLNSLQPIDSPPSTPEHSAAQLQTKAAAADTPPRSSSSPSSSSSSSSGSISGSTGAVNSSGSSSSSTSAASPATILDTTPPLAPIITAPSTDGAVSSSTPLVFSGTAEPLSAIEAKPPAVGGLASIATTTADALGAWSLSLSSLSQGTSTILFYATDAAGNISASSSRIVVVDTLAPSVSLSISTCNQSLVSGSCLLATTTLALTWASTASDLDSYSVSCTSGGTPCAGFPSSLSSTAATSTIYTALVDNTDYVFSVIARDRNGNLGTTATQTVSIATLPVVINEVAWAGTSAGRSEDEWIELYNPTASAISLAGWNLRSATDNTPSIALSGTIAARGYFLLERTDDTTISDITADQIYTGGLNNGGEQLLLSRVPTASGSATTTIDRTPVIPVFGTWAAGQASSNTASGGQTFHNTTMERIDPLASGGTASNWGTFSSVINGRGINADGVAIKGTPGVRNSLNYLPPNIATGATVTLTPANNPYIITSAYTVPLTSTLAIEPGVIIKFYNGNGSLTVHGTISSVGTAALPIIFTSFHDDVCGIIGGCGDTNATTTSPAMGDWASIVIAPDAANAVFSHAIIRYGGAANTPDAFSANLHIQNSSASVNNSVIEYAKWYGVRMDSAGSSVSIIDSTLRNNTRNVGGQIPGTGIYVRGGSPLISGNIFTNNIKGLVLDMASTARIENNTFTLNTERAIEITSAFPLFSGNTAGANGTNAITLQIYIDRDYAFSANLPYFMTGQNTVAAGATLTIPAGAIIKSQADTQLTVNGTLAVQGTPALPVIFTSIKDDAYGGDTNNDGASSAPAPGDWKNIIFTQNLATSTLDYAVVRYGGSSTLGFNNNDNGALRLVGASLSFLNSILEYNAHMGMRMEHSTSTIISHSFIREHRDATNNILYGLFLTAGSLPAVNNTRFTDNETHISNTSAPAYTDGGGNVFEP